MVTDWVVRTSFAQGDNFDGHPLDVRKPQAKFFPVFNRKEE
jgi:hypothetical protein